MLANGPSLPRIPRVESATETDELSKLFVPGGSANLLSTINVNISYHKSSWEGSRTILSTDLRQAAAGGIHELCSIEWISLGPSESHCRAPEGGYVLPVEGNRSNL